MKLPTPPITWKKLTSKATRQKVLGWLLVAALAICAICGAVALVKAIDSDTKTVHSVWARGSLDIETGDYVESTESIYTKKAFKCAGLEIELDFDAAIEYQVFFYDKNGNFLADKVTDDLDGAYVSEVPTDAYYARVVVTPLEDENVSRLEVGEYSGQIKISVAK